MCIRDRKIVLITGASSGIGEGCARKLAMNGYRLILNGRNVEKLNAVKKDVYKRQDEQRVEDDVHYQSRPAYVERKLASSCRVVDARKGSGEKDERQPRPAGSGRAADPH